MSPAAVVNIAETGDLLLVVGPEQVRLRVQSLILKATSKPFAAMLSPNWMEGRASEKPSTEKPVEILLPEDHARGLNYICAITHSRSTMIPVVLTPQELLDVAIMTDNTTTAAYTRDAEGNMRLLAVAKLFQKPSGLYTRALLAFYDGSYIDLYTEQIAAIIDWRLIYRLEEQRNSARLKAIEALGI